MKLYKKIELKTLNKEDEFINEYQNYSELTSFEKMFLLGLIYEKKPKKILEIGTAAGATTAYIWKYIDEMGLKSETYSVDLNTKMWNNSGMDTGFVAKKYLENNSIKENRKLMFGVIIPDVINKIGKDIDFLILDTVHVLPGEILDFLVCLPYLSDGAIVVMHDVGLNHIGATDPKDAAAFGTSFATKLLFDVVSADKYYMSDSNNPGGLPNIAAFQVTEETRKNIIDVFSILSITWQYVPNKSMFSKYLSSISNTYNKACIETLIRVYYVQQRYYSMVSVAKHYRGELRLLKNKWKKTTNLFIYGCGYWGKIYYDFAMTNGLKVTGFIVSDDEVISDVDRRQYDIPIYHLSEIKEMFDDWQVCLAVERDYDTCLKNLINLGVSNII